MMNSKLINITFSQYKIICLVPKRTIQAILVFLLYNKRENIFICISILN